MKVDLGNEMDRKWVKQVCGIWHFEKRDLELLERMAVELEKAADPQFFYRIFHREKEEDESGAWGEIPYEDYALCLVSLGEGADRLLESYTKKGRHLETYMLECLSMEMLLLLYERGSREIEKRHGFAGSYDFLEKNLESFLKIFEKESKNPVKYKKGCLIPQKSAVYLQPVFLQKREQRNICQNCSRADCDRRSTFH